MPPADPGDPPGRQTLVGESAWEAEAPLGKVLTVTYQDIQLSARKVRANLEKKTVIAEGDVLLVQGLSRLRGDRLDFDLVEKVGVVTNGKVDLEGGVHLRGALLSKVGPRSYTLTDGRLTACEGDRPAWEFSMTRGRFTLEEYARLSDATFRLGSVPLLYMPYLLWPVLRERASGFLIPGLGYNSVRGAYLGLAYYWAISRSTDATFVSDLYSNGWYGLGTELRARPTVGTRAAGMFYTVWDPQVKTWEWKTAGTIVSDDLAPRVRGVINWLQYSDMNFWQGYENSFNLASLRSVGSQAFVTWNPDPLSFNLRGTNEDALLGASTVVLRREPALEASLRPIPLLSEAVFVEASGQAGLLSADRGAFQPSGTYGRFDLFPRLSVSLPIAPWLSTQATGGGRITSYGKSQNAEATALLAESYNRVYGLAGFEMTGPSFSRIFDVSWGGITKLKHVIEPRVDYQWQSSPADLWKTPLFDEIDAVVATNAVRYAIVQRLLAKGAQGSAREIASLEVGSTYYFQLPGTGTSYGPDPLASHVGTLDATLRVVAGPGMNLDGRASWDLKAGQMTASSVTANWSAGEVAAALSFFNSHPVTLAPPPGVEVPSTSSSQIRFFGGTPVIPRLIRIDLSANYDLTNGKMLESRTLLSFQGSCYKVLFEYRDIRVGTLPSRDFRVALTLKNVGSFLDFTGSLSR
ncbi:MAG TPA: LPS assembly protein LptD [Thermoanaerobaculia bacterium]|nr:LPS assembly protein LptD [Thermoanaerobaculia bacterium]HQR66435.1 LPS assembly protein LptD [Thermoanaerobaculia bacterium]